MSDFQSGQSVYLPDGRKAEYVTKNGDHHLVRVIFDVPSNGYDEPPYSYASDHITQTAQVFEQPPVERFDESIIEKQKAITALKKQAAELHAEIREIERSKTQIEKAAAKYPDIADALDFIEGRITHIVKHDYNGATIQTLTEAFEDVETWGGRRAFDGMKLLCLFGTDKQGKRSWVLNQYRDGSGSSWTKIWPARSEDDARGKVQSLLDEALAVWRSGGNTYQAGCIDIADTLKKNPWLSVPDDWAENVRAASEKNRLEKIAKLRADIKSLEDGDA